MEEPARHPVGRDLFLTTLVDESRVESPLDRNSPQVAKLKILLIWVTGLAMGVCVAANLVFGSNHLSQFRDGTEKEQETLVLHWAIPIFYSAFVASQKFRE